MPYLNKLKQTKIEPGEPGYKRGEEYRLDQSLFFKWDKTGKTFITFIGAINDGASIPTIIPDILLNDHGKVDKPAVTHDDIYWAYLQATPQIREDWEILHDGPVSKKTADLMFKDGCIDEGIDPIRANLLYLGVRLNISAALRWGKKIDEDS